MSQVSPENYYDALRNLLCELFGHDWHLGYWLNASSGCWKPGSGSTR